MKLSPGIFHGREGFEVVSFDVFDTVLVRTVARPTDLFYLLGERVTRKGLFHETPEQFARARTSAALRARLRPRCGTEISLEQIYQEFLFAHPRLEPHLQTLCDAELELEDELLRPAPGSIETISAARAKFGAVAFVSDMYLPELFVRAQLINKGLAVEGDAILVSSAQGCTKFDNGRLFLKMCEQLGRPSRRILHVGDNFHSDFVAAKNVGLEAALVKSTKLNRYETRLADAAWESGGTTSILAGCSRLVRLRSDDFRLSSIVTSVLASVAAPLLVSFTIWVLLQARAAGLERVYFLAREGRSLYEIAKSLGPSICGDLEIKHLFVSRASLNVALLSDPTFDNLRFAVSHSEGISLLRLLQRFGLNADAFPGELEAIGLPRAKWDLPLGETQHKLVLETLLAGRPRAQLEKQATAVRARAEGYLEKEGVFDSGNIGLVDTSGIGSQFRAISVLRAARGQPEPVGFLIKKGPSRPREGDGFPQIHGFLTDLSRDLGVGHYPGLTQLLEVFSNSDHGSVRGYKPKEDGFSPLMGPVMIDRSQWDPEEFRRVLSTYSEQVANHAEWFSANKDSRAALDANIATLWNSPTREEARGWGGYPFEDGTIGDQSFGEVGPALQIRDLVAVKRNGIGPALGWYVWFAASKHRSRTDVRMIFYIVEIAKSMVGQVRGWVRKVRHLLWRISAKLF